MERDRIRTLDAALLLDRMQAGGCIQACAPGSAPWHQRPMLRLLLLLPWLPGLPGCWEHRLRLAGQQRLLSLWTSARWAAGCQLPLAGPV